jgi:hypothetical protein
MAKPGGLLALIGKADSEGDDAETDGEATGAKALLEAIAAKDAAGVKSAFKTMYQACRAEDSATDAEEDEAYE